MYDSTSATDIPADAEMVAGYVDGLYRWSEAEWAVHPHAVQVRIATSPATDDGDVLDCETGDATPQQVPGWIRMRQDAGYHRPTVYVGAFAVEAIRQLCSGLEYDLWVADWTGSPHVITGAAAVQYADPRNSGGHFDLSLVVDDDWPHREPPPPPEDEMTMDLARLLVFSWYTDLLHRTPQQSEVDFWAARLSATGAQYEAVYTEYINQPEVASAMSKEASA